MADPLVLSDGIAEAVVRPDLGGGLAAYDLLRDGRRVELFRRAPEDTADPFALACNALVPWSNRISGGGFSFDGRFHALAPNVPGEPFPIHGNGFQRPWRVISASARAVTLALASDGPGPFRYAATLDYALAGGALAMRLEVTHRASDKLPYGVGFHPWLPRTKATLLHAPAARVWLEDARHLPAGDVPVRERPAWDFSAPHELPPAWVNNGIDGWNGRASVRWPERGIELAIAAGVGTGDALRPLGCYLLYSPAAGATFFCFEPVSHLVDAHTTQGAGLFVLAEGERAAIACRFTPA